MSTLKRVWRGLKWIAHVVSGWESVKQCRQLRSEFETVRLIARRMELLMQGAVDLHQTPMSNWGVFVLRGKSDDSPDLVRVVDLSSFTHDELVGLIAHFGSRRMHIDAERNLYRYVQQWRKERRST